jgi:peptidoglycan/xylan/chitin deacetylase (PgdA/CDA1 family)
MSAKLTVLMYHALIDDKGRAEGADAHYAVTREVFRQHIAAVKIKGATPRSVASILAEDHGVGNAIAFTFDDGHASNADAAMDLASEGGSADFFINSSTVGSANILDWPTLREMVKAGASIQSHGHTHRYFDELSEGEIREELTTSKAEIEAHVGAAVTIFAPPGGRLQPAVARIAREVGFTAICSSSVGLWKLDGSRWNIPRFAVLQGTGEAQFRRWLSQDRVELFKLTTRQGVLDGAKKILGNKGYEKLRARLLGGNPPARSAAP